jgi:hypothetical protein
MARTPIEIPPTAAKAFMRDLQAFFEEKNLYRRDMIAGDQMRALREHQRPSDKPITIGDVKELFHAMKHHA